MAEHKCPACGQPVKSLQLEIDTQPVPKDVFLAIPLTKRDGEFQVTAAMVADWQEDFPAVDVKLKLREIRRWNTDNPSKRKTKTGIKNHISRWLAREQNKGGGGRPPPEDPPARPHRQLKT